MTLMDVFFVIFLILLGMGALGIVAWAIFCIIGFRDDRDK